MIAFRIIWDNIRDTQTIIVQAFLHLQNFPCTTPK
jgi:hypothetical protein